MWLRVVIHLSTAVLVPFGQARLENGKQQQGACEFGSVLEYFEDLPPIPRTCLAPLARLATPKCRDVLGIQDATVFVVPKSTEVKEVLTTALETGTVFETVAFQSTTTIHSLETETQTSTRTTTQLAFYPIQETKTTSLNYHAYPPRGLLQTDPGGSKSDCDSLARHILGLSHQSSVLSGACACLRFTPRTSTITGYPPDPATDYLPVTVTQTSTWTVTETHAVASTITKSHVQTGTQKGTTTKMVPAVVTETADICKHGYKGTRQNGIGNKVVPVPHGHAPSQVECCRLCGRTANCVASAWVPSPPPQAGIKTHVKPPCQLLVKEKPAVLPSNTSTEAHKFFGPNRSQICPLGIEVYDFGEESAEGRGLIFRGPCSIPKRRQG